jgi:hypothetical protein
VAALARAGAREAYLLFRDSEASAIADRDRLPALVGDAAVVASAELAASFGLPGARSPRGAPAIAARAAARLVLDPAGDDLRRLEPVYLRAPRGVSTESEAKVTWL